jgi:putative thioredoxin
MRVFRPEREHMADSPHIANVTQSSFEELVVARSHRVPVLVDYWADWCGPCQMQLPVLLKLVEANEGRLLLAKVNTDEERGLAREHGIRSLPTMRLWKNGEVVEEILGAQTESTLRIVLDRHVERPSDAQREAALELHRQGDTAAAIERLETICAGDPSNTRAALDLIEMNLAAGRLAAAEAGYAALPRDVRDETDGTRLRARLDFSAIAGDAGDRPGLEQRLQGDPDDLEARYRLAALRVLSADYEDAMESFLKIIRQDRGFRDDAGRKALLSVFELLGSDHELVSRYRRQLFNLMH